MTRDGRPRPSASSAPDTTTDTADTTNPRQISRRAVPPAATVSGFWVNRPISGPAAARHSTVPAAIMAPHRASASRKILCTRAFSPAP